MNLAISGEILNYWLSSTFWLIEVITIINVVVISITSKALCKKFTSYIKIGKFPWLQAHRPQPKLSLSLSLSQPKSTSMAQASDFEGQGWEKPSQACTSLCSMLTHVDKINLWGTPPSQLNYLTSLISSPNLKIQCYGIHYICALKSQHNFCSIIPFVPYQSSIAAKSTFFHSQSGLYLVFRKRKWLDVMVSSANRNNESYGVNAE